MEYDLPNVELAQEEFLKTLRKNGYQWKDIEKQNFKRYLLIKGADENPNYYLMFKRRLYFTGKAILEETINVDSLKECFIHNVKTIFIVYPDHKIYFITPKDFASKGYKRFTKKENKEVYCINFAELEELK